MASPRLSPEDRAFVDHIKETVEDGRISGLREDPHRFFLTSVAIAEMATERGGLTVMDPDAGEQLRVPPNCPWQEALPISLAEE